MEDDDDFGDLYTDVLRPLTAASDPPPPVPQPAASSSGRPIDLNLHSDDEEILHGASSYDFSTENHKSATGIPDSGHNLDMKADKVGDLGGVEKSDSHARVLERTSLFEGQGKDFDDLNFMDDSEIDFGVDEGNDKDESLVSRSKSFGDSAGTEKEALEPVIPGVSLPRVSGLEDGEGDDWESDSDDDLQIVLNDNNDGFMGMKSIGADEDNDEDDDDEDPLVIVADGDPNHKPMEEQEWGDDATPAVDGGERKDDGLAKVNGGVVVAPKLGYSSHGYQHPFHSQFKYVRPGAGPLPGAAPVAPGGTPGQVRPPGSVVPFGGRGRGDWQQMGVRGAGPLQKNFYGIPPWGSNVSGRGLDFTLPSHRTIFEVDIDNFEEKPWKLQGVDVSDFFNFGLNEESWKEHCKKLEQFRLESTMQSKIRVYESGRTEQDYDPDLPPELAAAAGIHDVSSANPGLVKPDTAQAELVNGSARVRQQLPTGRAIQVETGYGERLPSIDTRPPRIRDSDAIIEIVLQDSNDDDSVPGNDVAEQPDIDHPMDKIGRDHESDTEEQDTNHVEGGHVQDHPDSRDKTSVYPDTKFKVPHDERWSKRPDMSPSFIYSGSTPDKRFTDNQKEDSIESVGHKDGSLSSRITVGSADFDDTAHDEVVPAGAKSEVAREDDVALETSPEYIAKGKNVIPSAKKQKLVVEAEKSHVQEINDGEDLKVPMNSGNRKSRAGSSRDYRNMRDSVDREVVQAGGPKQTVKRLLNEDEMILRSRMHEQEDRRHMAMKERDDAYKHKKSDSSSMPHHSDVKAESHRRKESDSGRTWLQKFDDAHGRRTREDETRKRERVDGMDFRNRNKARERETSEKDERHHKVLENGDWKGRHHDKDVESRRKGKTENVDDDHYKRRKDETHLRGYAEKEEILQAHPQKRDRDEILDHRKRDDQVRPRGEDPYATRVGEDGWLPRERLERQRVHEEWPRLKQSHEGSLSKRDREGREGVKSRRLVEEKLRVSHSSVTKEYKRDRVENENISKRRAREDGYDHGSQINTEEKRSRHGTDRPVGASDHQGGHYKKQIENARKKKESDGGGDHISLAAPSRKNREGHTSQRSERVSSRGTPEQVNVEQEVPLKRQPSRKHKENVSSDDDMQDSRRGRSKLERWTSHKERDFSVTVKSSPSLNFKDAERYISNGASSLGATNVPNEESPKKEAKTNLISNEDKNGGASEIKSAGMKVREDKDKHLDTVEKLKKRSERFKLPMPSEKEALAIKKMEHEPLPSAQPEAHQDSEVKPERPTRKRRWTSG